MTLRQERACTRLEQRSCRQAIYVKSGKGNARENGTHRALNRQKQGGNAEMVNESGGRKYPPIMALQRRETMLGCCYHSSQGAGDGVVRGSGLCAMRRSVQLLLAPEMKVSLKAVAVQALQPVYSLRALSVVESASRETAVCPKSQESHHRACHT